MTNETRTRLWIGLFVLVVFLAGIGAGLAAGPWLGGGRGPGGGRDPGPGFGPGGRPVSGRMLDRMTARLDLSPDQTAALETLLDARRERVRTLTREMRDRFAAERRSMQAALAEILTPAQLETFEAEIVRMGDDRRRRRGGRDRDGDGRGRRRGF